MDVNQSRELVRAAATQRGPERTGVMPYGVTWAPAGMPCSGCAAQPTAITAYMQDTCIHPRETFPSAWDPWPAACSVYMRPIMSGASRFFCSKIQR